jgi:hypothetical protein
MSGSRRPAAVDAIAGEGGRHVLDHRLQGRLRHVVCRRPVSKRARSAAGFQEGYGGTQNTIVRHIHGVEVRRRRPRGFK